MHAGAAKSCKQGVRYRVRSLEHAYLIGEEGLEMSKEAGTYVVPIWSIAQPPSHSRTAPPAGRPRGPQSEYVSLMTLCFPTEVLRYLTRPVASQALGDGDLEREGQEVDDGCEEGPELPGG